MHTTLLLALLLATTSGDQCPPSWSYENQNAWEGLCATGTSQSPVVIAKTSPKSLPRLNFQYEPFSAHALNTARTMEIVIPSDVVETLKQGKSAYKLVQFHFHFPAEHKDGERTHAGELHLVHQDPATKRYHVVAVWIDRGKKNPALDPVVSLATKLPGCATSWDAATIDPEALLPHTSSYGTYTGSLTTPPCSEGVTFIILDKPITASAAQIAVLSRGETNARAPQNLQGRTIYSSRH